MGWSPCAPEVPVTIGSSDRRKSRRSLELPAIGSPDFGWDYRPYGDHSIPVSSLLDVRSPLLVLFLSSILCSTQSWMVVAVPRAIGKSVQRRLKIVPLFRSRLATPRRLTRMVVLVVPMAMAMATRVIGCNSASCSGLCWGYVDRR